MPAPARFQRLQLEIEGWLELGCWDRALDRVTPLLEDPESRLLGLEHSIQALVGLGRFAEALEQLTELRRGSGDSEQIELTEAWCRKRVGDVHGAAACMERLISKKHRSAIGHFNLGCYLALLGERERALHEITLACGLEPELRQSLVDEPDVDLLRDDPRFTQLLPR